MIVKGMRRARTASIEEVKISRSQTLRQSSNWLPIVRLMAVYEDHLVRSRLLSGYPCSSLETVLCNQYIKCGRQ